MNQKKRRLSWLPLVLAATLALFGLAGCHKPDAMIRIGTTSASQDQILAWMVRELAATKGLEAKVVTVANDVDDLQPALESNTLQVGIEFSQAAWQFVLKEKEPYTVGDLAALQRQYEKRQLYWYSLPMVNDHYTLAIRQDLSDQNDIHTLSDLARQAPELVLGGPTSFFEREDGAPWLDRQYDLAFKKTVNLDEENLIKALRDKKVDVIPVHTLDGRLLKSSIVALEDDQDVNPDSIAGIVINKSTLMAYPQLARFAGEIGRILDGEHLAFYSRLVAREVCTPKQAAQVLLKTSRAIVEKPTGG